MKVMGTRQVTFLVVEFDDNMEFWYDVETNTAKLTEDDGLVTKKFSGFELSQEPFDGMEPHLRAFIEHQF